MFSFSKNIPKIQESSRKDKRMHQFDVVCAKEKVNLLSADLTLGHVWHREMDEGISHP